MSKYRSTEEENLANIFKALSNPHRLSIFQKLYSCCPVGQDGNCCGTAEEAYQCVCDIGQGLDIAPSTLSHHLKELYVAGLLEMDKRGKFIYYRVVPEAVNNVQSFFSLGEKAGGIRNGK